MLGLGSVWVQSLRLSLWLPFKIHSQLTSGQEVGWGWGCRSETQFQEMGLCFRLSTISQPSLIELAKTVIENSLSGSTPHSIFQGRGPEIWFKKARNLFCPSDFFFFLNQRNLGKVVLVFWEVGRFQPLTKNET